MTPEIREGLIADAPDRQFGAMLILERRESTGIRAGVPLALSPLSGTLGPNGEGYSAMTAKKRSRRPRGGQPPARGFRPGKEPAHLKKQRAKGRLGSDASWLQKQTVEAIAGRSPGEVQTMVRKWSLGLIVGAVLLALLGIFLFTWNLVAGVVVQVLSVVLFFLAYRLRKQGPGLIEIAKSFQ